MRIALINPPSAQILEAGDKPGAPHLGLGYIAGYLRGKGISCVVIDSKLEGIDLNTIEETLRKHRPDIVGLTAMTHDILQAEKVAKSVRKILPQTTIVIGGPHATALPYGTLRDYPIFDIVVFGEGEYTFYDLITALDGKKDLAEIKGIGYREEERIQINEPRSMIQNLDELPFPAWDLFPKAPLYPIITTRGCPFRCIFCMRVLGNKVRKRSPRNVVDEIKMLINEYQAKEITFVDETFAIDLKHTERILDLMTQELPEKIMWGTTTRVDRVNYELLMKMKQAGCYHVGFGVESGNEDILKNTKKGITIDQVIKAIETTKRVGLETSVFFILGHPFETRQTIADTIKLAIKLKTTFVSFGIMVPYPNTEVYEMAKKGFGGYKILSQDWRDFNKQIGNALELEGLSRKDLEKLQLLAYAKFYLFNFRFGMFTKMLWKHRKLAIKIMSKIF